MHVTAMCVCDCVRARACVCLYMCDPWNLTLCQQWAIGSHWHNCASPLETFLQYYQVLYTIVYPISSHLHMHVLCSVQKELGEGCWWWYLWGLQEATRILYHCKTILQFFVVLYNYLFFCFLVRLIVNRRAQSTRPRQSRMQRYNP